MGKTYKDSRNAEKIYDERKERRQRKIRERFESGESSDGDDKRKYSHPHPNCRN